MHITPFESQLLHDLPVAAVVYQYSGGNLQVSYLNQAAMALWDCSQDMAKNKTMEELFAAVHPLDAPSFLRLEAVCKTGGKQVEPISFRLLRGSETLWIQMNISAIATSDGTITVYTTMTDVTQGKMLEQQLRIKEEEYRLSALHNAAYIFRYDLLTKQLFLSDNQEHALRHPPVIEDVPNSLIERGFVAPESVRRITTLFAAMQNGEHFGSDQVLCLIDGKQTLFHVQYSLLEDNNGEHTIAIGAFRDISNLKRRKSDQGSDSANNKLFQLMATHSKKHIFKYEHKTQQTTSMQPEYTNTFIELNYPKSNQHIIAEHVDKAYRPALKALHANMVAGKPSGELEYLIHNGTNSRWHRVIFTNVFEDNGENHYALLSVEDCTEQHERAKAYALYQQEKNAITQQSSMLEFNLSQRTITDIVGPEALAGSALSAEEILKTHLEDYVAPQDKLKVMSFFNYDRMLKAFDGKISTEEIEHCILLGGTPHWILTKARYYQDPYTDDKMALLSTTPSDEQHAQLEALKQATQLDAATGLYNYTTFEEKVNHACSHANPEKPGTFILIGFISEQDNWRQIAFPLLLEHFKKSAKALKTLFSIDALIGRLENYQFGIYLEAVTDATLLQDKLQLVHDLLSYSTGNQLLLRPLHTIVTCTEPTKTMIDLWQEGSLVIHKEKSRFRPDSVDETPKTPMVAYNAQSHIVIRTFGYFDVFLNGQAIHFKTAKAKELLALLVDRCGGYVDAAEGASILYEDQEYDERLKAKYRKVVMRLHEILTEYGIEEIIGKHAGSRKLNTHLVNCDYYHYLFGGSDSAALFNGVYLSNYSWGEETLATLIK